MWSRWPKRFAAWWEVVRLGYGLLSHVSTVGSIIPVFDLSVYANNTRSRNLNQPTTQYDRLNYTESYKYILRWMQRTISMNYLHRHILSDVLFSHLCLPHDTDLYFVKDPLQSPQVTNSMVLLKEDAKRHENIVYIRTPLSTQDEWCLSNRHLCTTAKVETYYHACEISTTSKILVPAQWFILIGMISLSTHNHIQLNITVSSCWLATNRFFRIREYGYEDRHMSFWCDRLGLHKIQNIIHWRYNRYKTSISR